MMKIDCFASGSSGNLYRLDDGRTQILLECGIIFREIQKHLDFKLSSIAACLITHEHKDHCHAVRELLVRGIPCYMSGGTALALGLVDDPAVHIVGERELFTVGTWSVLPFATQHDAAEPIGFLMENGEERILYATDTYYIRYKFPPCTVIMIECNHSYAIVDRRVENGELDRVLARRLVKSHMSMENLLDFFKANDMTKVRQIYLLHLSADNSDAAEFKKTVQQETGVEVYIA